MEYQLRPDAALDDDVRRIAYKQIDQAIGELSSARDPHRSVHEARKCLKRVRALMRLVQPMLGVKAFKNHDRRLRSVARWLSAPRDCQAMIETVNRLENGDGRVWNAATAQAFKAQLHRDRGRAEIELMQSGLSRALDDLADIRQRYRDLELKKSERYLAVGLQRSYRQARREFKRSYESLHDEDFHGWRKSAQHHWRHMQLLFLAWPGAMQARIVTASALSKLLGYDHDLTVLMQKLQADAATEGGDFFDYCRRRQAELRAEAQPHGIRLFVERPDDFAGRMLSYWKAAPACHMSELADSGPQISNEPAAPAHERASRAA